MQPLVDYFQINPDSAWFLVGFALLTLDAGIFGFSSGVLLFAGLGAVTTGLVITSDLLSGHEPLTFATFAAASVLWTLVLWKFLKRLQSSETKPHKQTSDLIGYQFVLSGEIDRVKTTEVRYSGIVWRVELDPEAKTDHIQAGHRVHVTSLDAGIFRVMAIPSE